MFGNSPKEITLDGHCSTAAHVQAMLVSGIQAHDVQPNMQGLEIERRQKRTDYKYFHETLYIAAKGATSKRKTLYAACPTTPKRTDLKVSNGSLFP